MNPKPFESLNHFTVPVGMSIPFLNDHEAIRASVAGTMIKGRDSTVDWKPLHYLKSCGRYFTTAWAGRGLQPPCDLFPHHLCCAAANRLHARGALAPQRTAHVTEN